MKFQLFLRGTVHRQVSQKVGNKINSLECDTISVVCTGICQQPSVSLMNSRLYGSCQKRSARRGHKLARFVFIHVCLWCTDVPIGKLRSKTSMASKQNSPLSFWVREDSRYFSFVKMLLVTGGSDSIFDIAFPGYSITKGGLY